MKSFLFSAVCLIMMASHAIASTNCVLSSSSLSCETSDFVTKYPDPEAGNRGIHADVTLTNSEGCREGVTRNIIYEISVPTHFDYSSMPLSVTPVGCNSKYEFQASNSSSPAFFLTSFLPQNEEKKEVISSVTVDKLEDDCNISVSMNFLWIDNVSSACTL